MTSIVQIVFCHKNSNEEFSVKFIKKPALFLIFERWGLLI